MKHVKLLTRKRGACCLRNVVFVSLYVLSQTTWILLKRTILTNTENNIKNQWLKNVTKYNVNPRWMNHNSQSCKSLQTGLRFPLFLNARVRNLQRQKTDPKISFRNI